MEKPRLKKTRDGFVTRNGVQTDTRFIRLENPDLDVRLGVTFHEDGVSIGIFPVNQDTRPWVGVEAPAFSIMEDEEGRPNCARAHLPSFRMMANDEKTLTAYIERVAVNLAAVDEAIAALNNGDLFTE